MTSTAPTKSHGPVQSAVPVGDCAHCGLPVPTGLLDRSAEHSFCCRGCETAFALIHEHQLEAYYRMAEPRAEANLTGGDPAADEPEFGEFDRPEFFARFARERGDQQADVDWVLDGIHCAACIWLIEKLPRIVPGVLEVRLNWARRQVTVRWDRSRVALSEVARQLNRLGYRPHPVDGAPRQDARQRENRDHLIRIGVAAALAGNNMMIAAALYFGLFATMAPGMSTLFRVASCLIGGVALLGPGRSFLQGAWAAIRTRTPHMDLPIALALLVGTVAGTVNTIRGVGEIYFDSLSVLILLLLVGRWLQFRQQNRAVDAVELLCRLTPRMARAWRDGNWTRVYVDSIEVGDRIEIRSGDLFPVDGILEAGHTYVDESMLSGESRPVARTAGDEVLAGTRNQRQAVIMRATTTENSTRLRQLIEMVEHASAAKPEVVQWANRIGGYFVVAVLLMAGVTLAYWVGTDPAIAIDRTVALLIVACPCALALATPLAISVALGRAAGEKILVKGGDALQRLTRPGMMWLDKTGTLTEGRLEVRSVHGDRSWIPIVASIEAQVNHPIADAIVSYAKRNAAADFEAAASPSPPFGIEVSRWGGIVARQGNREILVGTLRLMRQSGINVGDHWQSRVQPMLDQQQSPCWVAVDGVVVLVLMLGDQLRPDAEAAMVRLRAQGWKVGVLSGDHPAIVEAVGRQLGLDPAVCLGGVSPEEKLDRIRGSLTEDWTVVMVGDGVNDSAALAAASVGVAVHGGAEASLAAAPIYLARQGLTPLLTLLRISRGCRRILLLNLGISVTYNITFASLAFLGFINPLVAAVLMPISSLTVVATSTFSGWPGWKREAPETICRGTEVTIREAA